MTTRSRGACLALAMFVLLATSGCAQERMMIEFEGTAYYPVDWQELRSDRDFYHGSPISLAFGYCRQTPERSWFTETANPPVLFGNEVLELRGEDQLTDEGCAEGEPRVAFGLFLNGDDTLGTIVLDRDLRTNAVGY